MRGQRGEVLKHLKSGKRITSREAFEKYGATRLSAIIFDLRKLGMNISTTSCVGKNRYGESCSYAKYKLEDENE